VHKFIKPHQQRSLIKSSAKDIKLIKDEENNCCVISFKYLDKKQGQTFEDWESDKILAKALNNLTTRCKDTIDNQIGESFTKYRSFPPREKTDFYFPLHVPQDATWARIHITGKQCVVGHVYHNVFYIVFLDKNHRFWIKELSHT